MKLGEIKDHIRDEARMSDAGAMDVMLTRLVNDKLRGLTARAPYPQLQETATLSPVDATSAIDLPVDYQHFGSLRYAERDLISVDIFPFMRDQDPKYYRIAKPYLYVAPEVNVLSTHVVTLVYYKLHTLTNDSDDLLIDSMANTLINMVAQHVARFSDKQLADALRMDLSTSYVDLRAENVRN